MRFSNPVYRLASTLVALFFAGSANALVITASSEGVTTTDVLGATVVDFNDDTCGAYASCTGDFDIVQGSVSGQYAQPAGTTSEYLSVPNPSSNGTASLTLGTTANYFGLYWGSIDAYNTLSFLLDGIVVDSFTGTEIATYIPGTANGNQTAGTSNRYINFFFGSELIDEVRLTSTQYAFETDNHAFATVPEPGALALFGLGLTGLMLGRKRK